MTQVADLVDLRKFTPGRAAFAAKAVRIVASEAGDREVAEEAAEVASAGLEALALRRRWATRKLTAVAARGGGKAAELDNQLDRLIAALHETPRHFVRALPEDAPEAKLGHELITKLFPGGVAAITNQPFEDQDASAEALLEALQGPFAQHVQALGLGPLVRQLDQVRRAFHDALQAKAAEGVAFDEVTTAESLTQERLSQLVVLIAGKYRRNDAASLERRNLLLAPILEQNTRIMETRRRRRAVNDIDPDTGLEQEQDAPEAGAP